MSDSHKGNPDAKRPLDEIKADMPAGSQVFDFPEQENMNLEQRMRAKSYMHITQLLEKVLVALNGFTIEKVVADKAVEGDLRIFGMVRDAEKKWRDIFEQAHDHQRKVTEILRLTKENSEARHAFCLTLKNLPDDTILLDRIKKLTETLDGLEKHRKSGLLEAIAKI